MFVCLFMKKCKFFLCIPLPASCGIPFQVLPDYQEGAEQVSQHISVFKYVNLWLPLMALTICNFSVKRKPAKQSKNCRTMFVCKVEDYM